MSQLVLHSTNRAAKIGDFERRKFANRSDGRVSLERDIVMEVAAVEERPFICTRVSAAQASD